MADHAGGAVRLAIEPLNRFECYALNTAAQAARLVAEVDRPGYGYLYDTFHAHIEERNPQAAIAATAHAIGHVHISENDRGVPGAGQIDFGGSCAVLQQGGYDGWLVVEAFGQALPGLAAATRVWRPLFDTEADVIAGGLATITNAWTKGTT
jgi:D-psicose/D-tagatose/L-ribulose 3-epimerase